MLQWIVPAGGVCRNMRSESKMFCNIQTSLELATRKLFAPDIYRVNGGH